MSIGGILAACLSALLAASALHKLAARDRTRAATAALLAMPRRKARIAWGAALAVEVAAAAAMLTPGFLSTGAALAALLWLAYGGAAAAAWRRGDRRLDCGCAWGERSRDSDVRFVAARAGALALLAALLGTIGGGAPWREPLALASAFALLALGFAASQIFRNLVPQERAPL